MRQLSWQVPQNFILFWLTLDPYSFHVLCQVWEGGPLFGFTGRFVGMNLVPSMEKSFSVPVCLISKRLQHFATSRQRTLFLAWVNELKPERYVLQCFQFAFIHFSLLVYPLSSSQFPNPYMSLLFCMQVFIVSCCFCRLQYFLRVKSTTGP